MCLKSGTDGKQKQTGEEASQEWAHQWETYVTPYRERLDAYLDRRVVGNLMATVAAIVQPRSELTRERTGQRDHWPGACRCRNAPTQASAAPRGVGGECA